MAKRRKKGVDDDGAANWHRDALLMHPPSLPSARGTRVPASIPQHTGLILYKFRDVKEWSEVIHVERLD